MTKLQASSKLDDAVKERRKEAGSWLRAQRENAQLSQRDLARATGIEHYPFIAQIEHGVGRVPAERFRIWAEALKLNPRQFTVRLMSYYDRALFDLLFEDSPSLAIVSDSGASGVDDDVDSLVKTDQLTAR